MQRAASCKAGRRFSRQAQKAARQAAALCLLQMGCVDLGHIQSNPVMAKPDRSPDRAWAIIPSNWH